MSDRSVRVSIIHSISLILMLGDICQCLEGEEGDSKEIQKRRDYGLAGLLAK